MNGLRKTPPLAWGDTVFPARLAPPLFGGVYSTQHHPTPPPHREPPHMPDTRTFRVEFPTSQGWGYATYWRSGLPVAELGERVAAWVALHQMVSEVGS